MGRKKKAQAKPANTTIGYKGSLKITTLTKNNSVISVKQYNNTGCLPMFQCIGNILIGNGDSNSFPQYIRAFKVNTVNPEWSIETVKSNALKYVNTPRLVSSSDYVSIIYTFFFSKYQLTDDIDINAVALYSYNNKESLGTPSAYLILEEPLTPSDSGDNYIVEWTIKIGNVQ